MSKRAKTSISKEDKEFRGRDMDTYISYLLNLEGVEVNNEHINLKINHKFQIKTLNIKKLNEPENIIIQKYLQETLNDLFGDLNFEDPDQLRLTLGDYIDYVLGKWQNYSKPNIQIIT